MPSLIITPSLLDRLLDNDPDRLHESLQDCMQTINQLKQTVARDIEALFNSRQEILNEILSGFPELTHSLCTYGLPDFSGLSLLSPNDHARIRRALEQTVIDFEPRLQRVHVTLESPRPPVRALHFRVEALLHVEPARERVSFDAVLQLSTQRYEVKGNANAG